MKKVLLVSLGSYGDLFPFIETAKELRLLGIDSEIVAAESLRSHAESEEISFTGLNLDIAGLLGRTLDDIMEDESKKPAKLAVYLSKLIITMFDELFEKTLAASEGVSAIVASPLSVGSTDTAERISAKNFLLEFQPLSPTAGHQPPIMGQLPVNIGFVNKLMYWSMHKAFFEIVKKELNIRRKRFLNLDSIDDFSYIHYQRKMKTQFLFAYSKELLPKPKDWDENYHILGFVKRKNANNELPKEIEEFIGDEKCIYIGFGSMTGMNREKFEAEINKIADSVKKKIILHRGWSDIEIKRDNVLSIGFVEHDELFKHVDFAVTHNGCGTMASLLRNSVKSVGVPFALDQYFWADLLYRKKLAGRPVPGHSFSAKSILREYEYLDGNSSVEENLKNMRARISGEDGAKECAKIVERAIR